LKKPGNIYTLNRKALGFAEVNKISKPKIDAQIIMPKRRLN